MIILHEAWDKNGDRHVGYIVRKKDKYYIVDRCGNDIEVMVETILPISNQAEEDRLENYKKELGNALIAELNRKGIYTVREMSMLSEKQLMKMRGVGPHKYKQIQDFLRYYSQDQQ